MTSHYVSQENDPGHALYELEGALRAIEKVLKFHPARLYGDSVRLCSAAMQIDSMSKDLTKLANSVVDLHRQHIQAAE